MPARTLVLRCDPPPSQLTADQAAETLHACGHPDAVVAVRPGEVVVTLPLSDTGGRAVAEAVADVEHLLDVSVFWPHWDDDQNPGPDR